jgi:hypothetical protein
MKMTKLTIITTLFFLQAAAAHAECGTLVGNTTLGKVSLQCQNITGTATLTDTTITGLLTISGDLSAQRALLVGLNVVGNVSLDSTTVSGSSTIIGKLDASSSKLTDVELDGTSATFTTSTVQNILVKSSRNQAAHIILNNSVVNGNITFANGNGIVQNNNSKITGKVTGGTIKI